MTSYYNFEKIKLNSLYLNIDSHHIIYIIISLNIYKNLSFNIIMLMMSYMNTLDNSYNLLINL
jgi:hypothetical protein